MLRPGGLQHANVLRIGDAPLRVAGHRGASEPRSHWHFLGLLEASVKHVVKVALVWGLCTDLNLYGLCRSMRGIRAHQN